MRSALRHARAPAATLVFLLLVAACDHWPGVDENPTGVGGFVVGSGSQTGTCSGTPLPCEALGGQDCNGNSGCIDHGSCTGNASVAGESCGAALSYQTCIAIGGCAWAPNCIGTPLGTCNGATESSCTVAKGCVFTPSGSAGASSGTNGTNGTNGICATFGQTCTSSANCDCGLSCVMSCSTCRGTCGNPCVSDGDCTGTTGFAATATPFCIGVPSPALPPFTGVCSSSR